MLVEQNVHSVAPYEAPSGKNKVQLHTKIIVLFRTRVRNINIYESVDANSFCTIVENELSYICNVMSPLNVDLSIPFPSAREAEIAYQVLRVDQEPQRGGASKNLTLNDNLLHVIFSGTEARKIRVALTAFFDSLILVTETMQQFGPPEPNYNYY